MSESHEERIAREEETWTGQRYFALLIGTLAVALTTIYVMSSQGCSQSDQTSPADYSWYPFGSTPKADDARPSSVSGLVR
jgi:hypothetical protein